MKYTDGHEDDRDIEKVLDDYLVQYKEQGLRVTPLDLHGVTLENINFRKIVLLRADFSGAQLLRCNFNNCYLQDAKFQNAYMWDCTFISATLECANFRGAQTPWADFTKAWLKGADFSGANLDFCSLPLWCGGTQMTMDEKQIAQLLAHVCSMQVPDVVARELDKIRDFAKTSVHADNCGIL